MSTICLLFDKYLWNSYHNNWTLFCAAVYAFSNTRWKKWIYTTRHIASAYSICPSTFLESSTRQSICTIDELLQLDLVKRSRPNLESNVSKENLLKFNIATIGPESSQKHKNTYVCGLVIQRFYTLSQVNSTECNKYDTWWLYQIENYYWLHENK